MPPPPPQRWLVYGPSEQEEAAVSAALLTEDALETIGLWACDPLRPSIACAFAACNRSLVKIMRAQLAALWLQHEAAVALAAHVGMSCAALREAKQLKWGMKGLRSEHMRTLGALLGSGSLMVEGVYLYCNGFGDEGILALCEGLGCGAAPCAFLSLSDNDFGPDGAAALGAALSRGTLPKLRSLALNWNHLGEEGLAVLATPLRQLASLQMLDLSHTEISDDGLTALVSGPGEPGFGALLYLYLHNNPISEVGCAALAAALGGGALPALWSVGVRSNLVRRRPRQRGVE